jgi:hypothetical protein
MKKTLSFILMSFLTLSATISMAQVPAGMVSVFSIAGVDDITPITVDPAASYQFLGPASGWGDLANIDFSEYKKLVLNVTFDPTDAGHQVAVRFNVNGAPGAANVKAHVVTLPATGTTASIEIDIAQYATDGKIGVGGMVFYNGATHWSLTYDGTPAAASTILNWVAVSKDAVSGGTSVQNIKFNNPDAMVDVFNIAGVRVRKAVKASDATNGLDKGIYLVGGRKVVVSK